MIYFASYNILELNLNKKVYNEIHRLKNYLLYLYIYTLKLCHLDYTLNLHPELLYNHLLLFLYHSGQHYLSPN